MDILEKLKLNSEILKDTDISEKITILEIKLYQIHDNKIFLLKWWVSGSSATFFN